MLNSLFLFSFVVIVIQIFQSSANMYTWDKSSSNVTTGVIEVRVQCSNKERTKLTHFSDDVFINIPSEYYQLLATFMSPVVGDIQLSVIRFLFSS